MSRLVAGREGRAKILCESRAGCIITNSATTVDYTNIDTYVYNSSLHDKVASSNLHDKVASSNNKVHPGCIY